MASWAKFGFSLETFALNKNFWKLYTGITFIDEKLRKLRKNVPLLKS